MAQSFNKVVLVGRLTRDPELKSTKTGKNVCSFSLAIDKPYGAEGTDFIDCTAWEKQGENIAKYQKKGSQILIEGRLNQDTWEQDGQKRSKLSVVVNNSVFLSSKDSTKMPQTTAINEAKQLENELEVQYGEEIDTGDIPF